MEDEVEHACKLMSLSDRKNEHAKRAINTQEHTDDINGDVFAESDGGEEIHRWI